MNKVKGFEIVEKFLDDWKAESFKWYAEQKVKYDAEKAERKNSYLNQLYHDEYNRKEEIIKVLDERYERANEETEPYRIQWKVPRRQTWYGSGKYDNENMSNTLVSALNEEHSKFEEKWSHVIKFLDKKVSYEQAVMKALEKEYERKYEKLVADTIYITGDVLQADLRIGNKGNIEGFITGSKGKAELWSTLSGGVVQCLHFRFYCHKR